MWSNTTGQCNVALGGEALGGNIDGDYNTAVGTRALWSHDNDTGDSFGHGHENTAVGYEALRDLTSGTGNVGIGRHALRVNSTGWSNVAAGTYALTNNTTGYRNVVAGHSAMYSNTLGYRNIAIGSTTLYSNTIGVYNVAVGDGVMDSNISGNMNVAIGPYALSSSTTGSDNTAIGVFALLSNNTGSRNTAIGHSVGPNSGNYSNSTAIGCYATTTAGNQVRIGNSNITSIGGYVGWSNLADARAKKDVQFNVPGLDFINGLQPVTYTMDPEAIDKIIHEGRPQKALMDSLRALLPIDEKAKVAAQKRIYTGFIAQEVEKAAKAIGYDFSGIDVDEKGIYALRYSEFVIPLVKAVQELSEENQMQEAALASLKEQVAALTELVNKLSGTDASTLRSSTSGEEEKHSGISHR